MTDDTSASVEEAAGVSFGRHAAGRILELLHGGTADLALLEIAREGTSPPDRSDPEAVTRLDVQKTAEALREAGPAGAGSLPFHSGFFDYAIALDALEYLEPPSRLALLAELRRVSRRGVLMVGPFDSPIVRGITMLTDPARTADGEPPEPDAGLELPSLDEMKRFFQAHGDDVTVLGDGGLPLWVATRCLSITNPELGSDLHELEPRGPWRALAEDDHVSYRRLLVCLREAPEPGVLDAEGGRAARAEAGSVAAMLATATLAAELGEVRRRLAEGERRLGSARATLARRNAQIEDLSRRLADSLAALAAERGERSAPAHEIAAMQKTRAWRLLARLYLATGRLRVAAKAPARMLRDLARRARRRLRAL